jgi:hypothetical protein
MAGNMLEGAAGVVSIVPTNLASGSRLKCNVQVLETGLTFPAYEWADFIGRSAVR